MGIAACADNFIQDSFGSSTGIWIDGLIVDEVGVDETGGDLTEESDGFLVELLGVADIAEGDLVERVG